MFFVFSLALSLAHADQDAEVPKALQTLHAAAVCSRAPEASADVNQRLLNLAQRQGVVSFSVRAFIAAGDNLCAWLVTP